MRRWIGIFLFAVYMVVVFFASPHIGVSWDEPDNIWAAGVYINFFRSGMDPSVLVDNDSSVSYFHGKIFTQVAELRRYPPVPLYLGAVIVLLWQQMAGPLSSQQIIVAFHIASGVFWAILGVSAYYFARLLRISVVGSFLTSLFVVFHPLLFGYGLSIIKDSAQVALFALSLLLLVRAKISDKPIFLFLGALTWGSAMATKMNAIYVPIIWVMWRITLIFSFSRSQWKRESQLLFQDAIIVGMVGGVSMIVLWPYLWKDPIRHLKEVFSYFSSVGRGYSVFWNNVLYKTGIGFFLPWYPIVHILIGTPTIVLAIVGVGFSTLILNLLKQKKSYLLFFILLFFWIVVPLARLTSPYAAFYDGARHFLEIIPPMLLIAGWGIDQIVALLARYVEKKRVYLLITVCIGSYLTILHGSFFPYSAGYVNAVIRQPNAVVEGDISGISIKEAVALSDMIYPGPKRVFCPTGGHLSWYYLKQNDRYSYTIDQSDIVILLNKPSHIRKTSFDKEVNGAFEERGVVARGGRIFAWIYARRSENE